MWRVRGDTKAQRQVARERVRTLLEGLRGRIPGMVRIEIGLDAGNARQACDLVLLADFVSSGALAAYTQHPEYTRFQQDLEDLLAARFEVDFVIADEVR